MENDIIIYRGREYTARYDIEPQGPFANMTIVERKMMTDLIMKYGADQIRKWLREGPLHSS
jgi:hypothetical protein